MKVLVTGGAGYLGSVLVPKLVARGHAVRVVDVGYFGLDHLRRIAPAIEVVREDLRVALTDSAVTRQLLEGCDAIIHLAAISNDPSADLQPELAEEVNVGVTARLAEQAREAGARFLFSSSCSIYGEADGEIDESGVTNPLTVYASSKVTAERILGELADRRWSPTVLRNGTLYGYSTRMRFDLVVNIFSFQSALYNRIRVFGDGTQWRPFLHVGDCARAFIHFLEHPESAGGCYNVAHENLRVVDLVSVFKALNPRLEVEFISVPDIDRRNYRVSNRRMLSAGFEPRVDVTLGSEEMIDAIVAGVIADPESIFYRNAKWLRELTHIGSMGHRDLVGLIETFKHHGSETRG
ncbi:MAG: NAD-dependent epimerase/dehydratase family protein [Acidobacteriota bacterium]